MFNRKINIIIELFQLKHEFKLSASNQLKLARVLDISSDPNFRPAKTLIQPLYFLLHPSTLEKLSGAKSSLQLEQYDARMREIREAKGKGKSTGNQAPFQVI